MTLTQLTEIIRTADKKTIIEQFKILDFIYCNKDRKLGKVGIAELVNAVTEQTEDFTDNKRKHLYNGYICGTVKGFENYEFVFVNVYDIHPSTNPFDTEEMATQTEMLIFAKEIKQ